MDSPRRYRDLVYEVHPDVYEPADDTFLLLHAVEREPPGRLLEVGTGVGLVAIAAARAGHRVTATDRNPLALRFARRNGQKNNVHIDWARSDLLRGLRLGRFDTVAFNPPYLPTALHERVPGPLNWAFDGGLHGRRVLEQFLQQIPAAAPRILIVTSTLQGPTELDSLFRSHGLSAQPIVHRSFDAETLAVVRLGPLATRADRRIN